MSEFCKLKGSNCCQAGVGNCYCVLKDKAEKVENDTPKWDYYQNKEKEGRKTKLIPFSSKRYDKIMEGEK